MSELPQDRIAKRIMFWGEFPKLQPLILFEGLQLKENTTFVWILIIRVGDLVNDDNLFFFFFFLSLGIVIQSKKGPQIY